MFAYIKGILKEATPLNIVLEVNGIGYKIHTPVNLFSKLPQIEENILLFTSFIIRENSQTLYGFLSIQERDLFETLLSVTGVGPKVALCIIGHISAKSLHLAICNADVATISKIPGIGKKTAERLIVELKSKLAALFSQSDFADLAIQLPIDTKTLMVNDAMSALINLGYNQMTAQKAIKKSLKDSKEDVLDLGTLISSALQNIN